MNKKGFTLIELLAVIVVLAVIALIATPIVMNVIKNVQKGATERSAERYLDAVEQAIAVDMLTNPVIKDGIYEIDADGNLILEGKVLEVEVSGEKPKEGGTVVIQNSGVVSNGTIMTIGDYTVTINDKGQANAYILNILCNATSYRPEQNYYITTTNKVFDKVGTLATETTAYKPGTVYSCDLGDGQSRIFYVLKEVGDMVKLIMSENISETVTWCLNNGKYSACNANNVNTVLENKTRSWIKLASSQVALPEAQDLADAMGYTSWTPSSNSEQMEVPIWLRTNQGDSYLKGYWTSTIKDDFKVWKLDYHGLSSNNVNVATLYGVRPVITISKDNISLKTK